MSVYQKKLFMIKNYNFGQLPNEIKEQNKEEENPYSFTETARESKRVGQNL